jgi:hypothetical protein
VEQSAFGLYPLSAFKLENSNRKFPAQLLAARGDIHGTPAVGITGSAK